MAAGTAKAAGCALASWGRRTAVPGLRAGVLAGGLLVLLGAVSCTASQYGAHRPDPVARAGGAKDVYSEYADPEDVPRESAGVRRAKREQAAREREEAQREALSAIRERRAALPEATRVMLDELEAGLVEQVNRLRVDPAGYVVTLDEFRSLYRGQVVEVPGVVAVRTREGTAAVDEARAHALGAAAVDAVVRSAGLSHAARAHAFWLSERGQLAHGDSRSASPYLRMALYGRAEGMYAEIIGAVYRDPELMIVELFVDDGVESRVHRFNLMGEMFRVIGVGCAPHERYQVVCVLDFAEAYYDDTVVAAGQ